MKVYKYKNYNEYVNCQKAAFERKYKNVWAKEENIKAIAEYLKDIVFLEDKFPFRSLCHGVRQGFEVKWFNKYLPNCVTIGTDIGEIKNPSIIQWDFNIQNPDWIEKFDFIYSNSFDHAFNPAETFCIWCEQVKKGGHIVLEYDRRQEHTGEISKGVNKTDPVSIRVRELYDKIPKWYPTAHVIKILDMPIVTQEWRKAFIIEVN